MNLSYYFINPIMLYALLSLIPLIVIYPSSFKRLVLVYCFFRPKRRQRFAIELAITHLFRQRRHKNQIVQNLAFPKTSGILLIYARNSRIDFDNLEINSSISSILIISGGNRRIMVLAVTENNILFLSPVSLAFIQGLSNGSVAKNLKSC